MTVELLYDGSGIRSAPALSYMPAIPYIPDMTFIARMSPFRAVRDLRIFLATREPYELWFLVAAMSITGFLIYAFAKDSYVEKEYRPRIVYVEQWKLDRTDAQIVAQQKIDQAKKAIEDKRIAKEIAERQAAFKRIDDRLKKYGI